MGRILEALVSRNVPSCSTVADQPGSTTVVDSASMMIAGPAMLRPGARALRWWSGIRCAAPANQAATVSALVSVAAVG
ncbi:MAG TPA: hypothetical protein VJ811_17770, partial [Sphingopyxis sp.]|nr:hypothetical protein [Sphingopyxis sp.]